MQNRHLDLVISDIDLIYMVNVQYTPVTSISCQYDVISASRGCKIDIWTLLSHKWDRPGSHGKYKPLIQRQRDIREDTWTFIDKCWIDLVCKINIIYSHIFVSFS